MSTPGGKVSVFTGYGTGKTQSTAGAARRKEAKPPARRRGEKRQIPARQAPWGGNRRQRSEYPPGPAGRAAEAGSTPPQSRKESRKAPKKKAPWEKRGQRKNGEEQEKGQKSRSAVYKTRSRAPAKPSSARGISTTYGAGLSAKYALPEEYKIPTAEDQTQSAGTCRRKGGRRTSATHTAQDLSCEINPATFQHKRHAYCAGLALQNKSSGLSAQAPRILRRTCPAK